MTKYITEDEAINSIMQEAQAVCPNVPPMVTLGVHFLRNQLSELHEQLSTPENQHLAAEVAECISLTREIFEQMEAGYDALVETQGQTWN